MKKTALSLSDFLQSALIERQSRNPKYSLRAFARDLGISPGACSDFLQGRRSPGPKISLRIAESLGIDSEAAAELFKLIEKQKKLESETELGMQLAEEQFSLIANREHFAILNLMKTVDFKSDLTWISNRLGFSEKVVKAALQRMELLGLVQKENNSYRSAHGSITTSHDISSDAIKEHHRQNILFTVDSLTQVPPEFRDITTISTATNPENIERAKILIRKFRRKLAKVLAEGEPTEVYSLNIQLIPLTKIKKTALKK